MSLALIKQFYGHVGRGEFEVAGALLADDAEIVFHGPASVPLSGCYVGKAEIGRFFGIVAGQLDVQLFEPRHFIDAGAEVVVLGRERSRVKATGAVFDVRWCQVWRTANGRITNLTDYFDTGSMAIAFNGRG